MRVAFLSMQQAFLDALHRQQAGLARTEEQVGTGRRFTRPGQDPVAATQALGLDAVLARNTQFARNAVQASNRLSLAENVLAEIGDLLQRARELAVQAANGPLSGGDRAMLGAEVAELQERLLALANTRDGNGEYLFAGHSAQNAPFTLAGGTVSYSGDQGQRQVQIGPDRFVADGDHGAALLLQVRNGDGTFHVEGAPGNAGTGLIGARGITDAAQYDRGAYSIVFTAPAAWEARDGLGAVVASGAWVSGESIRFRGLAVALSGAPATGDRFEVTPAAEQSVFVTLGQFAAALAAPDAPVAARVALANDLGNVLQDLDQSLDHLLEARAGIGARLSAIEAQQDQLGAADIELRRTLSGLRDTDYAAALSQMQQQLTSLQAAQQSFVRVASLSLFDYL